MYVAPGKGDSLTYAVANVSPELEQIISRTPRSQHRDRLRELAAEFYLSVPVLLGLDLVAIGQRHYRDS